MSTRAGLLFAFVLLIAANAPAQDAKKELDKLQGNWTIVSMEAKGKKLPDEKVKGWMLTIKGDQWTFMFGTEYKATVKIDPAKDPKTIDMTFKAENKEALSPGIYKLEGDTFTLCRTIRDPDRPTEFKTSEETGGRRIEVWKRAKK